MGLVLLTLGLIAEQLSPSGATLHTVGVIDVVIAIVLLIFWLLAVIAKAFE